MSPPLKEIKANSVKTKILLDLFAAPISVIPIGTGLTAIIGTWGMGGPGLLAFGGACAVLFGLGTIATRVIYGIEKIAKDAQEYVNNVQKNNDEVRLNQLGEKLRNDGDPRTDNALQDLRSLREEFRKAVANGNVTGAAKGIMSEKMDALFEACVKLLGISYDIKMNSLGLRGRFKEAALKEREKKIDEVLRTINTMGQVVQQCFSDKASNDAQNLASLRAELEQSLEVARRTDEEMAKFDVNQNSVYNKNDKE